MRFISNPDDSIESFAILGDDNNKLEKEIEELESELGSNEEGKETGLYANQKIANTAYNTAFSRHKKAEDDLERQLANKVTDKEIGIKYKPEHFGDQNYTIEKLKDEIAVVKKDSYQTLTDEQLEQHEKLITERVLPNVSIFKVPNLNFKVFVAGTDKLVTKRISESDKIEKLVKDAVLNRWVNEGRSHHRGKHDKCAFCDNTISQERWVELDKYFDEESEQLEKDIDSLILILIKKKISKSLLNNQSVEFLLKISQ